VVNEEDGNNKKALSDALRAGNITKNVTKIDRSVGASLPCDLPERGGKGAGKDAGRGHVYHTIHDAEYLLVCQESCYTGRNSVALMPL
jgi:hypothetical protein